MYTKNLKAHRGTDNQILIEFMNQDQKPVDVTGMEFTCRLIDREGETLLLEKLLEEVNTDRGQMKLVLLESELDRIHPQDAHFSVERVETGRPYEPVYVDDYAGARGNIEILDSVMPRFVASGEISIPQTAPAPDYVSSLLETDDQSLYTFVLTLDDFTGDVVIQGATSNDNQWYEIQSFSFTSESGSVNFNISGHHPYIRVSVTNNTTGAINKIQYR